MFDYASNIKVEQNITTTGEGSYTLEANQLNAGTYHYSLIINGVVVDTRIMFLVK